MPRLADPATVPGLPESRRSDTDLARLPEGSAGAPWRVRMRALVWWQRARHPAFDWGAPTLPLVVVAFVDYRDTPVGPYQEVLAAAMVRRGRRVMGQVPFIAVNSLPSVHGGRANWALPKTTASFRGGAADGAVSARGDGWSVTAHAAHLGPQIPVRSSAWQTGPLGDYRVHLRARGRPVLVDSSAVGPTLTPWLGAGRHLGMSTEGEMIVGPPQAA